MQSNVLHIGYILKGDTYTYKIEKILGQGSFGITYLASTTVTVGGALGDIETTIKVAVKEFFMDEINGREGSTVTMSNQNGICEKYKHQFAREARNLSQLKHKNIVKVLETFEGNNTIYYTMEFCEGGSLNDLIEARGKLNEKECMAYISEITSALSFMHAHNVLHLDLKPGNIMLRKDGSVALIDFGLSKQYDENGKPESSTNIGGGTPGYAPLEQSNYKPGDKLATTLDIYALGGTMFKMLTGERPPTSSEILNEGFPDSLLRAKGVSGKMIQCIEKAMESKKKNRFQTVTELVAALGGTASAASEETEKTQRKNKPTNEETEKGSYHSTKSDKTEKTQLIKKGPTSEETEKRSPAESIYQQSINLLSNKNFTEGIALLRQVAEQGHVKAQNYLGSLYLNGRMGLKQSDHEAYYWFKKAAEQGYDYAQYNLGNCYHYGHGVAKNLEEAVHWYYIAGMQGNREAIIAFNKLFNSNKHIAEKYKNRTIPILEEQGSSNNNGLKKSQLIATILFGLLSPFVGFLFWLIYTICKNKKWYQEKPAAYNKQKKAALISAILGFIINLIIQLSYY